MANYGISDLQEIIDAGMPLPAVNQVPYHLYNAGHQQPLKAFCAAHGIRAAELLATPALPANSTRALRPAAAAPRRASSRRAKRTVARPAGTT